MPVVAAPSLDAASTRKNDPNLKTRNFFFDFFEENFRLSQQHDSTNETDGANLQRLFQMREDFVRTIKVKHPGHPA
jgi:hypothetical protein